MAFTRALGSAFLVFIVTFARAEVTISDLSGVWRSYTDPSDVNILTPQGPVLVCRDTIPPACDEEITPVEVTLTFNGTAVSLEVRDRTGITTVEESAAAHPECAKDGIYPIAWNTPRPPPGQITSYNAKDDRIYFIDPRRPDELNCVVLRYGIGENGPYIEANVVMLYEGSIPNIVDLGLSYRCVVLSETCSVDVNEKGELDLAIQDSVILTCIDGDCLDAIETASPSASNPPKESSDDLWA